MGSEASEAVELECRVCRLGPEHGRPLYAPCLCAGSILFCHQDCLEMWLSHSGKDRCELCGAKFEFAPVYVEGAPGSVPLLKAARSLLKMLYRHVLSLLGRTLWTAVMWLGVVPVCTSLLYRIWIHRGSVLLPDLIRSRIVNGDVWSDCIAGVIIVAIIVISFLSLMSFVDFLRFHWGHEGVLVDEEEYDELHDEQQQEGEDYDESEEAYEDEREGNDEEEEEEDLDDQHHFWGDEYGIDAIRHMYAEFDSGDDEYAEHPGGEYYHHSSHHGEYWVDELDEDDSEDEDYEDDGEDEDDEDENDDDIDYDDDDGAEGLGEGEGEEELGLHPDRIIFPDNPARAGRGDEPFDAVEAELDDVRQADVEIHVAIDEVLGWRGPIHISLRNVIWLLAFNGAYIGLFCFVPYSIGSATIAAIQKQVAPLFAGFGLVPQSLVDVVTDVIAKSSEVDRTLQLPDMAVVFVGYAVIASFLFSLAWVTTRIQARIPHATTTQLSHLLSCAAAVCKVAMLLFLRIVLLPVSLGTLIMAGLSKVFPYTREDWIMFAASNVMGLLTLLWVVGITYMLIITVSVLQLREILHPVFLAQFVRPKEPHPDLFVSLVREPALVHAKRIASTSAIYVALMIVFINIPVALAARLIPAALPLQPHFVYFIPQLQVPLELAFAYALALGILDGNRVSSGQLMYKCVKAAAGWFGLTRFLLPHPLLSRHPPRSSHRRRASQQPNPAATTSTNNHGNSDDDALVGPPLVRPPLGWNNPDANSDLLWAYGRQRKGEVERGLAPIKVPSHIYVRCAAALAVVWVGSVLVVVAALLLPVVVGRGAMRLLHVPTDYAHDPACVLIGLASLWCAKWIVDKAFSVVTAMPRWCASCRLPPLRFTMFALAYLVKVWGVACPALGSLLRVVICSTDLAAYRTSPVLTVAQDALLGFCILHGALTLAHSGVVDRLCMRLRLAQAPFRYTVALRRAVQGVAQMVASCEWDLERLEELDSVSMPVTGKIFRLWGVAVIICSVLVRMQQQERQLSTSLQGWSLLASLPMHDVDLLVLAGMRLSVVVSVLFYLVRVLAGPAWRAVNAIYVQIRDECYVTGRQLQNSTKGQALMQSSSTTIEDQLASLSES